MYANKNSVFVISCGNKLILRPIIISFYFAKLTKLLYNILSFILTIYCNNLKKKWLYSVCMGFLKKV